MKKIELNKKNGLIGGAAILAVGVLTYFGIKAYKKHKVAKKNSDKTAGEEKQPEDKKPEENAAKKEGEDKK